MVEPTRRLTVAEVVQRDGRPLEELLQAIVLDDENAPALCEDGCEVEPDGHCPHGHPSILLALGMI